MKSSKTKKEDLDLKLVLKEKEERRIRGEIKQSPLKTGSGPLKWWDLH